MRNSIVVFLVLFVLMIGCKKDDPTDPNEVYDPTPYELVIPHGFADMIIPADNPLTVEGIALGRMLYYDNILSGDNSQSCASCHAAAFNFTDNGNQFSKGVTGDIGTRNSPAVINIGWMPELFWDGRAVGVEEQCLGPVPNPVEMNLSWIDAASKLNAHGEYPDLFFKAFGTWEIDSMLVAKAIAQFERTMISANSKWDRYQIGEVSLSEAETKGFEIFFTEKGDCFHCHSTILFADNLPHNNGLDTVFNDPGYAAITNDPNDLGKFKTPTVRNVVFSAPYMHDGRFETLEEVIDFYSEGVKWSPTIDPVMHKVNQGGLHLTPVEKQNLIAFIKTLTDTSFINNPDFSNPF